MLEKVYRRRGIGCHAGCQEMNKCHTPEVNVRNTQDTRSTLALKLGVDITRSPKQGYQWPHKRDKMPSGLF